MKYNTTFLLFFIVSTSIFSKAQIVENKIYSLFFQKQYEKVIELVEEAATLNADEFYYAGLSAEMLEDSQLAAYYLKKSMALDSTNVAAKKALAQALFQNEELVPAAEIYIDLLETDTLNAFLWRCLGDCYAKLMLLPLAYTCYQNAFYLNPKNSANTLKLISVLGALKSDDYITESLFYCDSSLMYNENHKPLLRKKASLYFVNHEYLKAAPLLDSLLGMKDSSFLVLKHAGICHALQKPKSETALHLLRKAYQQVPTDKEVMLHLANSLSLNPNFFDEAVEIIAKIRKSAEPDSTVIYQTHTFLAQSFLGIKDTVNAIRQYYYSMNQENIADRLLRLTSLANNVTVESSHTLLWYVHYFFLQNLKIPNERSSLHFSRQKSFSIFLMEEYIKYMHLSGQKKVTWETLDGNSKMIIMSDLQKVVH
ncbi:MAG: hypothetical protein FWC10_10380 [Lentimicrobiaceae bacterium]|nr:hypothetical protein [Lentimicrobiaceae bacterium]